MCVFFCRLSPQEVAAADDRNLRHLEYRDDNSSIDDNSSDSRCRCHLSNWRCRGCYRGFGNCRRHRPCYQDHCSWREEVSIGTPYEDDWSPPSLDEGADPYNYKYKTGFRAIGKGLIAVTRPIAVTIPASVTDIGWYAFEDCTGVTEVTIPSSVTKIGRYAFGHCDGLTVVKIPASARSIGFGAFQGCTGLTAVTIPASVTSIGNRAVYGCTSLVSVRSPIPPMAPLTRPILRRRMPPNHHRRIITYIWQQEWIPGPKTAVVVHEWMPIRVRKGPMILSQ